MIRFIVLAMFAVITVVVLIIILTVIIRRKKKDENKETETYWDEQNTWLVQEFSRCNVIVFGKKGSGKDVTFNHVMNLRGVFHYSNMPYNALTRVAGLDRLSVGENSYENFINSTTAKFQSFFEDCRDYYISDAGIYLPSQYDKELDKRYPGMPLFYALSRQLHRMNIHANVQALGRLWKKLREQADSYIWIRKTVDCGEHLVVHAISYDRYESAERRLLPVRDKQYGATYGDIQERKFKVLKKDLEFDTYYFRKVLLYAEDFAVENHNKKITLKEIISCGYRSRFK